MTTLTLAECARLLWQAAHGIPAFVLARITGLAERQRQRNILEATVGKDEATLWIYATGGDTQAALTLVHDGYDHDTIIKLKEDRRPPDPPRPPRGRSQAGHPPRPPRRPRARP